VRGAALWDEVKHRLNEVGSNLSGVSSSACASRARSPPIRNHAVRRADVGARPDATASIEELISELKKKVTILIVTHNMQQAARVSDYTAYMYWRGGRIRQDRHDLLQAPPQGNRGLHHRPLRLTGGTGDSDERPHLEAVRRRDGGDPQRRALHGRGSSSARSGGRLRRSGRTRTRADRRGRRRRARDQPHADADRPAVHAGHRAPSAARRSTCA